MLVKSVKRWLVHWSRNNYRYGLLHRLRRCRGIVGMLPVAIHLSSNECVEAFALVDLIGIHVQGVSTCQNCTQYDWISPQSKRPEWLLCSQRALLHAGEPPACPCPYRLCIDATRSPCSIPHKTERPDHNQPVRRPDGRVRLCAALSMCPTWASL